MVMAWIYLLIAGLFEIAWAIGLKYTDGFTKLTPSIFTIISLCLSVVFLAKSAQTLPIGTAYAGWAGIGALGVAVLGIFLFNESSSCWRVFFLATLVISIVGLKFHVNN